MAPWKKFPALIVYMNLVLGIPNKPMKAIAKLLISWVKISYTSLIPEKEIFGTRQKINDLNILVGCVPQRMRH